MTVRPVTPWITAISGHVQIHGASCAGDCCNFDALQDERATGEDIFDPEWPDKPVRFGSPRGSNAQPVPELSQLRECRVASPMHGPAGEKVGCDHQSAGPTSSSPDGTADRGVTNHPGAPAAPSDHHVGAPTPFDAKTRPGAIRDGS